MSYINLSYAHRYLFNVYNVYIYLTTDYICRYFSLLSYRIHIRIIMPPKSRKRNKGKERKAKQQAKKEEEERADANEYWRKYCGSNQCDHGHEVVVPDDHPVSSFIDQFYINLLHKGMSVIENLRKIFESHTNIWNNESYRKLAIGLLKRIGTNLLLRDRIGGAVCTAKFIVVLEHYIGTGDINSAIHKRAVRSKSRDLRADGISSRRDALKFYRKRITCKCLKKIHLEARKTTPKTGICGHCKQERERVSLSTCSRCMVYQYCSRECQVAGWPCHKEYCDDYVQAYEKQTKNEKDCGQTEH